MIVTDLNHIEEQIPLIPSFRKAIEFLRLRGVNDLLDGRVEIEKDRLYAIIQRYKTQESNSPKFECHRKYIDIQLIASGTEIIGWSPSDALTITETYDANRDVAFGTVEQGTWTPVRLQRGQLAVFWPEDAHAPKLAAGKSSPVTKIVVKIAV